MAAFHLIIYGRFWVITEADRGYEGATDPDPPTAEADQGRADGGEAPADRDLPPDEAGNDNSSCPEAKPSGRFPGADGQRQHVGAASVIAPIAATGGMRY